MKVSYDEGRSIGALYIFTFHSPRDNSLSFANTTMSGEASDNPFQFTARENDGTGLYYYRARYYSPEMQKFIQEDPIGLMGGMNYYAYVDDNVVNFVDPFGLWWVYQQSTGNLYHYNEFTGENDGLVGTGYAGHGAGYNNPNYEYVKDTGPIPHGIYDIGRYQNNRSFENPNKVFKDSMRLYPRSQAPPPLRGRPGLLMHHGSPNGTSSRGCIVAPDKVREVIGRSGDKTLVVVP